LSSYYCLLPVTTFNRINPEPETKKAKREGMILMDKNKTGKLESKCTEGYPKRKEILFAKTESCSTEVGITVCGTLYIHRDGKLGGWLTYTDTPEGRELLLEDARREHSGRHRFISDDEYTEWGCSIPQVYESKSVYVNKHLSIGTNGNLFIDGVDTETQTWVGERHIARNTDLASISRSLHDMAESINKHCKCQKGPSSNHDICRCFSEQSSYDRNIQIAIFMKMAYQLDRINEEIGNKQCCQDSCVSTKHEERDE